MSFIRELLSREWSVRRIRKVGPTNQGDGGRDFVIEYIIPDDDFLTVDKTIFIPYKIIVQCSVRPTERVLEKIRLEM